MARGGYRPNSGPKKGAKYNKSGEKTVKSDIPADIQDEAAAENLDPLSYMLKVMNDPNAEKERRDRMAVAAAPFCHSRKGEGQGKKQEKDDRAKAAGSGRFASSAPPRLVVNK